MRPIRTTGLLSIALLGTLVLLTGCFPAVQVSEERSDSFSLTGKPIIDLAGDDIDVLIHSQQGIDRVDVKARLSAWGTSESDARRNLREIELTMTQHGNEIRIRLVEKVKIHFGIHVDPDLELEITMPDSGDFHFHTDDGDVEIRNVSGYFDIRTDDGDIDLFNVTGQFDLQTDDGNIEIRDGSGSLEARTDDGNIIYRGRLDTRHHRITSDDGDITLVFPQDQAIHIDISMDNGSIHSTLPFTSEIRSEHHWSGTLNSADATLTISTDDGDISIREL